ncbi:FtsX-like permease family protein [bacterium]|nr:FtsX-like permease family protein [bacterium]
MNKFTVIFSLSVRYLKNRGIATILSIAAIALSLFMLIVVGSATFSIARAATDSSVKYPLIVGPDGSSGVRLLLSSLLYLDSPSGLLDAGVVDKLEAEPGVIAAVPIARADNYMTAPIVGTTQGFIDSLGVPLLDWIGKSEEKPQPKTVLSDSSLSNAVIGFRTANRTGLRVGDSFNGMHGMTGEASAHKHKEMSYRVVAILSPTNSPQDDAIFSHYKSVWLIHNRHLANGLQKKFTKEEHAKITYKKEDDTAGLKDAATTLKQVRDSLENNEKAQKFALSKDKFMLTSGKLSAILIQTSSPAVTGRLERKYSSAHGTIAVDTGRTLKRLINYMNKAESSVSYFNYLMLLSVLMLIFVTLIMSLRERKKELALLRSIGVGKKVISMMIMSETLMLVIFGVAVGVVAGHAMLWYIKPYLDLALGTNIEPFMISKMEINGVISTLLSGVVLSLIMSYSVYRMNLVEEIAKG